MCIEVERAGLPQGVQRLLALAEAVPERQGVRRRAIRVGWLSRIGRRTLSILGATGDAIAF